MSRMLQAQPPGGRKSERSGVTWRIHTGDTLEQLRLFPDESVHCCVTSPPYWGLRDYGVDGQLGLEETPEQFVAGMVEVFAEVRRVLRSDGTLWLNIGDSYNTRQRGSDAGWDKSRLTNPARIQKAQRASLRPKPAIDSCKPKDLIGIPWLLAFALRTEGWYLRRDIIWSKPNPMPESVIDRPTSSHEYLFLLTKAPRYYYDAEAIRESATYAGPNGAQHSPYSQGFGRRTSQEEQARQEDARREAQARRGKRPPREGEFGFDKQRGHGRRHDGFNDRWDAMSKAEPQALGRNKRSVWTIATRPFPDAHFATFPPDLVEPCILAGTAEGDTVLDPFAGAATTGLVATQLGRDFVGIELNPEYVELGENRIRRWEADPAGQLTGDPEPMEGQTALEIAHG